MKKSILLSLVLLLSCVSADAVNWQKINTGMDNTVMFIDEDSVKMDKISNDYLYAVKYSVNGAPEKVIYLKSDYLNNLIGIIRTEDYSKETYKPTVVFNNPHVFMKPIQNTPFLEPIHFYTANMYSNMRYAETETYSVADNTVNYEVPVSYQKDDITLREPVVIVDKKENVTNNSYNYGEYNFNDYQSENDAIHAYLVKTCNKLTSNWQPPAENEGTLTIIFASISNHGKIVDYRIEQSSGSVDVDKSVVDALYKSEPYYKLPTDKSNVGSMEFRFVFDIGILEKKVVY